MAYLAVLAKKNAGLFRDTGGGAWRSSGISSIAYLLTKRNTMYCAYKKSARAVRGCPVSARPGLVAGRSLDHRRVVPVAWGACERVPSTRRVTGDVQGL